MLLEEVKQQRIEEQIKTAVQYLDSIGCSFSVTTPWGEDISNKLPTTKKRRPSKYAHGVVRNHVKKHIPNPNEPIYVIPVGAFDIASVASNAGAYAHTLWGKGSYSVDRLEGEVVVSRKLSFS